MIWPGVISIGMPKMGVTGLVSLLAASIEATVVVVKVMEVGEDGEEHKIGFGAKFGGLLCCNVTRGLMLLVEVTIRAVLTIDPGEAMERMAITFLPPAPVMKTNCLPVA